MPNARVIFQNWIVDIGYDPGRKALILDTDNVIIPNERVTVAVRSALKKMSEVESEFIERYYFQGESYLKIGQALRWMPYRVEALHRRAVQKFRKHLAAFVKREFGVEIEINYECPLCKSSSKEKINKMIKDKKPEETWKKIIKTLKEKYKITIKTPQILIGHQKYHLE
jgi:ABC-type metal ion transport system substrate-binding protein